MLKRLTATLIAFAAPTAAVAVEQTAIWDRYSQLICRANEMQFCTPTGCEKTEATAVYLVDFTAGTIKSAVSKNPAHILQKKFWKSLGHGAVVLDSSEVFSFSNTATGEFGAPLVKGVKVDAGLPMSDIMWMDCHAQP